MGAIPEPAPAVLPGRAGQVRNIQLLRAVAAAIVVLYHGPKVFADMPVFKWTGFGGVDLFFVITGYLMTSLNVERFGRPAGAHVFLLRRIARIYPAYWIYFAIFVAALVPQTDLVAHAWAYASSAFLWPQGKTPPLPVAWTLTYEMFYYLVFTIFFVLPAKWFRAGLAVWALVTVGAGWWYDLGSALLAGILAAPVVANPMNLEFIAGCALALRHRTLVGRDRISAAMVRIGLGVVFFFGVGSAVGFYAGRILATPRLLVFGLGSLLILDGAVRLERLGYGCSWRLPIALGDSSYSLYLIHLLVLPYALVAWSMVGGPPRLTAAFYLLASIVVGWVGFRLVERPVSAWARIGVERLARRS